MNYVTFCIVPWSQRYNIDDINESRLLCLLVSLEKKDRCSSVDSRGQNFKGTHATRWLSVPPRMVLACRSNLSMGRFKISAALSWLHAVLDIYPKHRQRQFIIVIEHHTHKLFWSIADHLGPTFDSVIDSNAKSSVITCRMFPVWKRFVSRFCFVLFFLLGEDKQ